MREWLKELRNNKKLTQKDVADRAGIERSYYTMIETGKRTPSPQVSKRIALVIGFDWTIFFDNQSNETTQKEIV